MRSRCHVFLCRKPWLNSRLKRWRNFSNSGRWNLHNFGRTYSLVGGRLESAPAAAPSSSLSLLLGEAWGEGRSSTDGVGESTSADERLSLSLDFLNLSFSLAFSLAAFFASTLAHISLYRGMIGGWFGSGWDGNTVIFLALWRGQGRGRRHLCTTVVVSNIIGSPYEPAILFPTPQWTRRTLRWHGSCHVVVLVKLPLSFYGLVLFLRRNDD